MVLTDNPKLMITLLEYLHPAENWQSLAFGILGGLEVDYQCNLLRSRPIRLQIITNRIDFHYLSRVLQLPYYSTPCSSEVDNWQEVQHLKEEFSDVFIFTSTEIFEVQKDCLVKVSTKEATSIHRSNWVWSDQMSIYAVEGLREISSKEIILLCLAEQVAYFQNSTGVERKVQNWINHIRRKSLRKSWPELLKKRRHYFWMTQQLYSGIMDSADVGDREKYVEFLRVLAQKFDIPELAKIALGFRRSIQNWTVLAMALLDGSSTGIADVSSPHEQEGNLALFLANDQDLDISFRLEVIENSLQEILEIERETFRKIGQVLQRIQLEQIYIEKLTV